MPMDKRFDFSVSHYLGMRHSSRELEGWDLLTLGVPAALRESELSKKIAQAVANLQGLETGVVATSSLHLFWDWFGGLDKQKDLIFIDEQMYEIGKWGAERAFGKGVGLVKYKHQNPTSLYQQIRKNCPKGNRQLIIVTDGWCPICGKCAPIHVYSEILKAYRSKLVIDDTQALGVLGKYSTSSNPLRKDGGGILSFHPIDRKEHVLIISSLAKAFGVPLATLSGSKQDIEAFKRRSETRLHSSPPSIVALQAANNALRINSQYGAQLRERLLRNINIFQHEMKRSGFDTLGSFFPVQRVSNLPRAVIMPIYRRLLESGIRIVPVTSHNNEVALCWILTATHQMGDIKFAVNTFEKVAKQQLRHVGIENQYLN
jgi:8-amino-7-oxononanoate synthase